MIQEHSGGCVGAQMSLRGTGAHGKAGAHRAYLETLDDMGHTRMHKGTLGIVMLPGAHLEPLDNIRHPWKHRVHIGALRVTRWHGVHLETWGQ